MAGAGLQSLKLIESSKDESTPAWDFSAARALISGRELNDSTAATTYRTLQKKLQAKCSMRH